jgi:hypothetical protein
MDTIDNLKEPVKSSEQSGSGDKNDKEITDAITEWEPILKDYNKPVLIGVGDFKQEDIDAERRKVVELSNESVLHGYDMAIELLETAEQHHAAKILGESREIIELGLKNSINERIHEVNDNSTV